MMQQLREEILRPWAWFPAHLRQYKAEEIQWSQWSYTSITAHLHQLQSVGGMAPARNEAQRQQLRKICSEQYMAQMH